MKATRPDRPTIPPAGAVAVTFFVITGAGFFLLAPSAWPTALLDGITAALLLGPAALAGLWLVPLLGLSEVPIRWHLLLGGVLGIGLLSLLVLIGGLAGALHREIWVGVLAGCAVLGVLRLRALKAAVRDGEFRKGNTEKTSWLWLLLAPFLALALAAAANAPGFLWSEEGFGYDVLEYHLQMPKEYFDAGRIQYAPHNVYANFPANVEMLFLLGMILMQEDVDAGTLAHMIHLLLGAGFVFAAWVAGCEWSRRGGLVAALVAGTAGWVPYLSGLAYVELGLLCFGMTAAAVVVAGWHRHGTAGADCWTPLRAALVAGLVCGLACGCKYTAAAFVALPIAVALLLAPRPGGARVRSLGCFLLGLVVTFAPWLGKNGMMTGNPVFPLAQSIFGAQPRGWDEGSDTQWRQGHAPKESERAAGARLTAWWRNLPGDHYQRFGPMMFLLPIVGWLWRKRAAESAPPTRVKLDMHGGSNGVADRGPPPPVGIPPSPADHRIAGALVVVLVIQTIVWLFASHLYARFAVVMMIPLSLLAGYFAARCATRYAHLFTAFLIAGAAWNTVFAVRLHRAEAPGGAPASLIYRGQLPGYDFFRVVNEELPADAHILLVGEARPFYFRRALDYAVVFNRQPLAEAVRSAAGPEELMAWLRTRGYSHVLVHWLEVDRLRRTYGFPPEITEALFEQLEKAGLARVTDFANPAHGGQYVTLYRVPG